MSPFVRLSRCLASLSGVCGTASVPMRRLLSLNGCKNSPSSTSHSHIKCHVRHLVAVGTPITRRPPRRSVQAVLPHTALASDSGGKRYSPHIAQSMGHANSRTVSGTCQIERCFSLVHAL